MRLWRSKQCEICLKWHQITHWQKKGLKLAICLADLMSLSLMTLIRKALGPKENVKDSHDFSSLSQLRMFSSPLHDEETGSLHMCPGKIWVGSGLISTFLVCNMQVKQIQMFQFAWDAWSERNCETKRSRGTFPVLFYKLHLCYPLDLIFAVDVSHLDVVYCCNYG